MANERGDLPVQFTPFKTSKISYPSKRSQNQRVLMKEEKFTYWYRTMVQIPDSRPDVLAEVFFVDFFNPCRIMLG
jgi:hypothetical protein